MKDLTEIEEAVIGAVLLEPGLLEEVGGLLKVDLFRIATLRKIYEAICTLRDENKPIDLLTVVVKLKETNVLESVGGPVYLSQLTSRISSTANVEEYIRALQQRYIRRTIKSAGSEIILQADDYENDSLELLTKTENKLNEINELINKGERKTVGAVLDNILKRNDKIVQNEGGLSGIPTGLRLMDHITGGFQETDLIILAARPGMGKTSLALKFWSEPALRRNIPTAFFSLEMSSEQLMSRVIAQESGLKLETILRTGLRGHDLERFNVYAQDISKRPLYIDDTAGINVREFRANANRLKRENNIQLIVVDYLQLMTSGKNTNNMNEEVSTISRTLKLVAKELKIPVIALSQLSRKVEDRGGDKRPQLSDLRESGAIEQDADMVQFLYRPEYYGIMEDHEGNPTEGTAEIIIAKHRNGGLGKVNIGFEASKTRFYDQE